jgi:hypothetical protein
MGKEERKENSGFYVEVSAFVHIVIIKQCKEGNLCHPLF